MTVHRVVEQLGDVTFTIPAHPSLHLAMLRAIDLCVASDEERFLFVVGPDVKQPIPVGSNSWHNEGEQSCS